MYKPTVTKPLVYVAGPYSVPDPVENTNRAIRAGMMLWETGKCGVLVPHLSLLAHMVTPKPVEYWYEWDVDQLLCCDALWRLTGESVGADNEVSICHDHSIPVYHEFGHPGFDQLMLFCDQIIKGTESVYGY